MPLSKMRAPEHSIGNAYGAYGYSRPSQTSWMDEILDYVSERLTQFTWLIRPLLGLVAIFAVVSTFSLVLSTFIYYTYRPVSMIREPVYFDFSQTPPVARVTLSAAEKQWRYLKRTDIIQDAADMGPSYLSTGSIYSFHLEVQLAKSDRNRGTLAMLTLLVGVFVSVYHHLPFNCISLFSSPHPRPCQVHGHFYHLRCHERSGVPIGSPAHTAVGAPISDLPQLRVHVAPHTAGLPPLCVHGG